MWLQNKTLLLKIFLAEYLLHICLCFLILLHLENIVLRLLMHCNVKFQCNVLELVFYHGKIIIFTYHIYQKKNLILLDFILNSRCFLQPWFPYIFCKLAPLICVTHGKIFWTFFCILLYVCFISQLFQKLKTPN